MPLQRARSYVFGLDLDAPWRLRGTAPGGQPGARTARLDLFDQEALEDAWPATDVRLRTIYRFDDGRPGLTISEHSQAGFRFWGEDRGTHVVSRDGATIACGLPSPPPPDWERFLTGQVLPLAAVLQGLETLHASAVSLGDRAFAITGPSGSGKTTFALRLIDAGARLMTDDVLALEQVDGVVLAHPGPALADELPALSTADPAPAKQTLEVRHEHRSLQLAGLYLLDAREQARRPGLEPLARPELLLGSTFNPIVKNRRRLAGLLNVCAGIVRTAAPRTVVRSSHRDLDTLAAMVAHDVEERVSRAELTSGPAA